MKRKIRIEGDIAYVPLTRGYEAVIDAADVPLVQGSNWCAKIDNRPDGTVRTVYAARSATAAGSAKQVDRLHRLLLNANLPMHVDHIDGDGLNNRRSNLRLATLAENNCNAKLRRDNKSGHKGVTWDARRQSWKAGIRFERSRRHLGYFGSVEDAAAEVSAARQRLHGQFGRQS